ncbi:MAG: glycosyltransferase family 2 protein [Chitinophagaceae bacterium]|nr:glycosyltransferase family 2 protein [Chitinophagaceae bacterium]
MEKVIAVVVTYNRQALLSECIDALRRQTRSLDAILVINNGSTDSTEEWLKTQSDVFFVSQRNVGSSGGFSTGINWAYQKGYSWIWCMDDDGYPKEDALANLLAADNGNLRLMNCAVVDKQDKQSFVWKTGEFKTIGEVDQKIIEGIGHPFNGTMLHRRIIERVGTPQPKFFLWGDETEYYYRIVRRNQIPVCTVTDSIHYHPSTAFSIKQDWDYRSGWKMYYYVRNRFHIHQVKFNNKAVALLHYCCFLFAFAGIVLLFQKTDKLKKLGFLMWPATDAFTNNFEATPPAILNRLQTRPAYPVASALNNYLKNFRSLLMSSASTARTRRAANA